VLNAKHGQGKKRKKNCTNNEADGATPPEELRKTIVAGGVKPVREKIRGNVKRQRPWRKGKSSPWETGGGGKVPSKSVNQPWGEGKKGDFGKWKSI